MKAALKQFNRQTLRDEAVRCCITARFKGGHKAIKIFNAFKDFD